MHLVEFNIARLHAPLDDPSNREFVAALDGVNLIGDRSEGFVWRLQDESGRSSSYITSAHDANVIVNLTVWSRSKRCETSRTEVAIRPTSGDGRNGSSPTAHRGRVLVDPCGGATDTGGRLGATRASSSARSVGARISVVATVAATDEALPIGAAT